MSHIYENKTRDKYGRTRYEIRRNWKRYASITVLPKVWVDAHPGEPRYLVNSVSYNDQGPTIVAEPEGPEAFPTLAAARLYARALV